MHRHFIEAKFIGPTNSRGSRVKLISARFEESIVISYDHSLSGTSGNAEAALAQLGYEIVATFETEKGYGYLVAEFVGLKEAKKDKTAILRWREQNR